MEKNWSYKIPDGPHAGKTLWSGRYCAVAAFVFRVMHGEWSVLANLRGSGTPDYQGCWNAVCGFLEANETAQQCCSREIFEETGYIIDPEKFLQVYTQTNPETSNNGNVTLRHIAIIFEDEEVDRSTPEGGEENEVDDVKWIPIYDINGYKWAFNHEDVIDQLFYQFIYPLEGSVDITPGEYLMLSNQEWLAHNLEIRDNFKEKLAEMFGL
jgi:ADP-ribose pyrophosphatase YjhB (NUDIX family)